MAGRMTLLAAVTGVLAALLGIVPTYRTRLSGTAAANTSAFAAVEPLATTGAELVPLAVLALAAGVILYGTSVL